MAKIEVQLKKMKGNSYKAGPPDKGGQQYYQWVDEMYKDSVAVGERYEVTFAEQLREYHISLTLYRSTRMMNARRHLQKYFDSLNRELFTEIDQSLERLFHKAMQALDRLIQENREEPENPLRLTILKKLLLQYHKQLHQGNKDHPNKAENERENKDGNEGDGTSEDSTFHNSPEKADNKEDNMSDDIEASESVLTRVLRILKKTVTKKERSLPKGKPLKKNVKTRDLCMETKEEVARELDASGYRDSVKNAYVADGKWNGLKGIVFTRTRESTEALLQWIKETEELNAVLRPEALVGSGDGKSKYGLFLRIGN